MKGTLPIDIRIHGIRLARRSGTTQQRERAQYVRMCHRLGEMGRLDLVRAIRDKRLDFAELYERYRLGDAANLPAPELFRPLAAAWGTWLKAKPKLGGRTRTDYEETLARLLEITAQASISDLPAILRKHAHLSAETRPSTFNRDWRAVRSFLGSLVGRYAPLYAEVSRVERLEVEPMAVNPQTPDQVRELAGWMQGHRWAYRGGRDAGSFAHHARTLWGLCLTGMRPEEFWEERIGRKQNRWELLADRVSIQGTKGAAAVRVVPRVAIIAKPGSQRAFRRALDLAAEALGVPHVTLYDCRRTFAVWLDDAGIPDNRQDAYMGHGPKNMRELYRRPGKFAKWLVEDAAALGAHIGAVTAEPGLRVVR